MSGDGTKVVSIKGEPLPEAGTPNEKLVERLEEALDRARLGQTAGIVLVEVSHRKDAQYAIYGHYLTAFSTMGALSAAQTEITCTYVANE